MEKFRQKLLLVEDDQQLSVSLIRYYQQQGFIVDYVVSGKAAVDHIIRQNPQIVICKTPLVDLDSVEILRMVLPYFTGKIIWNDSNQNRVTVSFIEQNIFHRESVGV